MAWFVKMSKVECPDCDGSFEGQRGLNAHFGQMHDGTHLFDDEEVESLFNEGLKLQQIADELGVSYGPVQRAVDRLELDTGRPSFSKYSPWRDAELMEELYQKDGKSPEEIAEEISCSRSTVTEWLAEHGIRRKGRFTEPKPRIDNQGYERIRHMYDGEYNQVLHHRLIAVAEYGFDEIKGKHVHHENGLKWDNRPANIEILDPGDHCRHHIEEGDYGIAKTTEGHDHEPSDKYGGVWQKRRQEVIEQKGSLCQGCGSSENIQVHHITPVRKFADPQEAHDIENLVPLCSSCHTRWEGVELKPELVDDPRK